MEALLLRRDDDLPGYAVSDRQARMPGCDERGSPAAPAALDHLHHAADVEAHGEQPHAKAPAAVKPEHGRLLPRLEPVQRQRRLGGGFRRDFCDR